jgi:hypothetical protein
MAFLDEPSAVTLIGANVRFWHKADITAVLIHPLLGVKQTLIEYAAMSAFDPKRTSAMRLP